MTSSDALACVDFDDAVDDLVRGMVDEPARTALLDHAATCERCDQLLAELMTVADRLLHFAPDAEPPLGFETRAVARMKARDPVVSRPRRLRLSAAAAALIVVGLLGGVAIGRGTAPERPGTAVGPILTRSGSSIGTADLVRSPRARIVLTMNRPRSGDRWWACDLRGFDGQWVEVGTWTADELTNGVWAAGVDRVLVDATHMRIRDDAGRVVATATLR